MEDPFLYERIAEELRQEILRGKLRPGDRLPTIRSLEARWSCTAGTIQRAYQELARQGLVTSSPRRGTFVTPELDLSTLESPLTLRRAALILRAEKFLLETLSLGYSPGDTHDALETALERWHQLRKEDQL